MTSNSRLRLVRLGGLVALGGIIFASLMLPTKWEQLRTGHWALEHFLTYFAAVFIVTLGWGHPWAVAAVFVVAAALLEALQSLIPNHSANLLAVLSGLGGTLVAVLLAKFVVGVGLFRPGNRETEARGEDGSLLDARPQNHVGAMSAIKAAMARNWLALILAALLIMVLYGRYTLGQTLTTLDQTLTKLCGLTQEALEWPTGERRPPLTSETSDDNATSRSSAGILAPWVERLIEQVARENTQLPSEDLFGGQLWRWQHANREQIEKICSERRGK